VGYQENQHKKHNLRNFHSAVISVCLFLSLFSFPPSLLLPQTHRDEPMHDTLPGAEVILDQTPFDCTLAKRERRLDIDPGDWQRQAPGTSNNAKDVSQAIHQGRRNHVGLTNTTESDKSISLPWLQNQQATVTR
jgi:hypothetical protein